MDSIPPNPILKFHPDTMKVMRKKYNLDKPGDMDQAIDLLDDWIKKQEHFIKKDFPREYLERLIIQLKGSVERAKSQIDKLCTLRTLMPHFFEKCDAKNDLKEVHGYILHSLLPNMTEDYYRIYFTKIPDNQVHNSKKYFLTYLYCTMLLEYAKSHDYCDGFITVIDLQGVNIIEFTSHINIAELRELSIICLQGYCARIKGIHIISTSNAIDILVKIFKQLLSEKVANRMRVHKTVESLHEWVPKKLLPKEYGGDGKPLEAIYDDVFSAITTEKYINYLKIMREARTNESKRPVATFNEQYMGMPGTFRTFNVD